MVALRFDFWTILYYSLVGSESLSSLSPPVSLEHKGSATPASILKTDAGMLLALQFSSFTDEKLFL